MQFINDSAPVLAAVKGSIPLDENAPPLGSVKFLLASFELLLLCLSVLGPNGVLFEDFPEAKTPAKELGLAAELLNPPEDVENPPAPAPAPWPPLLLPNEFAAAENPPEDVGNPPAPAPRPPRLLLSDAAAAANPLGGVGNAPAPRPPPVLPIDAAAAANPLGGVRNAPAPAPRPPPVLPSGPTAVGKALTVAPKPLALNPVDDEFCATLVARGRPKPELNPPPSEPVSPPAFAVGVRFPKKPPVVG